MRKKITLAAVASLVILMLPAFAKKVDQQTAVKVARNFFYERASQQYPVVLGTIRSKGVNTVSQNNEDYYYIINFEGNGWVIVSAEDVVQPVLAYSFTGEYVTQNIPENHDSWMNAIRYQISMARQQNIQATDNVAAEWTRLGTDSPSQLKALTGKAVTPLITSTWDQGRWYNELCPVDAGGDAGHVYTGCVATSMAQVMYYWRYPNTGNGSKTYNHPTYGMQTANYGATTYHWTGMMNSLAVDNFEVAQLMYHCGVSVNMNYGPSGSGAQTPNVPNSLVAYFKYSSVCQYVHASNYSATQWTALLVAQLDQKHPMMYDGMPAPPASGAGHCWVCDGYQGTDYFHFNWGWSGSDNGYYYVTSLNPPGSGGNFNASQGAVINIIPASGYPYNCSGQTTITDSKGTIADGSGPVANYQSNSSCSWLISPDDSVTSIKFNFEKMLTDTLDMIRIYNGATTSDPLLGTYSGSVVPTADIVATGTKMLITFTSDGSIENEGFFGHFTCSYPQLCHGTTLTDPSGTLTDGSGPRNYLNNTLCTFSIQPNNNPAMVAIFFDEFDLEPTKDYVKIYDLVSQQLLQTYSGHSIPPPVTSFSGQMYVEFRTDGLRSYPGWTAHYESYGLGVDTKNFINNLSIYPNPASDKLGIKFENPKPQDILISLNSLDGKTIYTETVYNHNGAFEKQLDVSSYAKGVYFLQLKGESGSIVRKVVVQ